jgi:TPR repeat protein
MRAALICVTGILCGCFGLSSPKGPPREEYPNPPAEGAEDFNGQRELLAEGNALYEKQQYREALNKYKLAYPKSSLRNPELDLMLSLSYYQLGDMTGAARFCQRDSYFIDEEAIECDLFLLEVEQRRSISVDTSSCQKKPAECRTMADEYLKKQSPFAAALLYLASCKADDAQSCARVAELYETGVTVGIRHRDHFAETNKLYQKACSLGVHEACGSLALFVTDNVGRASEEAEQEVVSFLTQKCEQDSKSCAGAAILYGSSRLRTLKQDAEKALSLALQTCEAGVGSACNHVGRRYVLDKERIDYQKAASFYEKACSLNDGLGCNNLAQLYYKGRSAKDGKAGFEKNLDLAMTTYQRSCAIGDLNGCDWVGYFYQEGIGVTQDKTKALALYEQNCASGYAVSCQNLGGAYSGGKDVAKDLKKSLSYYERACALKDFSLCVTLGGLYRDGVGGSPNGNKGVSTFFMACNAGNEPNACFLAAKATADFSGGTLTERKKYFVSLYETACSGGVKEACYEAVYNAHSNGYMSLEVAVPRLEALCKENIGTSCWYYERIGKDYIANNIPVLTKSEFAEKRKAKDLSGANLSAFSLSKEDLSGLKMKKTKLPNADLKGANLSYSDLSGADLRGANLSGANLSGANLDAADLTGANLSGVDLRSTKFSTSTTLNQVNFNNANLSGKTFDGYFFLGCTWVGADLTSASFIKTSFTDAKFHKSILSSASFKKVKFVSLSLTSSQITGNYFDESTTSNLDHHANSCQERGMGDSFLPSYHYVIVDGSRCN